MVATEELSCRTSCYRWHRRVVGNRWFVLFGSAPDAPRSGPAGLVVFLRILGHWYINSRLPLLVWGLGGRLVHVLWFVDPAMR